MSIFRWLFAVFLLVPLAEIYVLLKVGPIVGALPTIALVVLTAVVGAALMRAQGFSTIQKVQRELAAGQIPAVAMVEGAFILVAGALLLTPGFITDFVGFCCLFPPFRQTLIRRMAVGIQISGRHQRSSPNRIIDAEFTRHEDRG